MTNFSLNMAQNLTSENLALPLTVNFVPENWNITPPLTDIDNPCPGTLNGPLLTLFMALINSLYAGKCALKPPSVNSCALKDKDKFDYIIVGAGSAGCVLANRLSQNINTKVLLIEAGDNPTINSEVPAGWEDLIDSPSDWSFKTEKQENACLGFKDKVCRISSGKVLGGTSSIDAMVYLRGIKQDYANWLQLGDRNWHWKNLSNIYRNLEKNYVYTSSKYHGNEGELKVDDVKYTHTFKDLILNASVEMGNEILKDANGFKRIGWGSLQGTIYQGRRWSAYKAFIAPIQNRPNLCIATKSQATKIHIETSNKTASGVQVKQNTKSFKILAKKEIIITAGAINSPKLLILSGLGHWDHLQKLGIHIIKNLPVGKNLQDHISFLGFFVALSEECDNLNENLLEQVYQYLRYSTGSLSTVRAENFYGFINTIKTKRVLKTPNVQIRHIFFKKDDPTLYQKLVKRFRFDNDTESKILEVNKKHPLILFIPTLLYPKSQGYLNLSSTNPDKPPKIYPNYLTEEEDITAMLEAIQYLIKLTETKAFDKFNPFIVDLKFPHCLVYKFKTSNYYRCILKHLTTSAGHFSGTAKMGLDSDLLSVVNTKFQVRGVERLRVVGNAIAPSIVSDLDAGSSMMGELAAKFIKGFNKDS